MATIKKNTLLNLMCVLLVLAPLARAQEVEPIVTDRPDFTESPQTVPAGKTQIEAGVTFSQRGVERGGSFGEVLVRHALGTQNELRFELPNYASSRGGDVRTSNLEDGSVGFKTVLARGSGLGFRKPNVSLIGSVALPLGSRAVRGSGVQPGVKLLLGVDLSPRFSLSSNLNAAYLKDGAGRFGELSGSLSLGIALSGRVGSFVEVFGFAPGGGRESSRFLNGGFTFLLNPDFQLDARAGVGLGNRVDGPDHFFGFGASRRF